MSRYGALPAVVLRLAGLCYAVFGAWLCYTFLTNSGWNPFAFASVYDVVCFVLVIYVGLLALVGVILFLLGKTAVSLAYGLHGFVFGLAFIILSILGLLVAKGELVLWLPPMIASLIGFLFLIIFKSFRRYFPFICFLVMAMHYFGFFWIANEFFHFDFASFFGSYWAMFLPILMASFLVALFSGKFYNATYGRVSVKKTKIVPAEPTKNWKERGMLFSNKEY